MYQTYVSQQQTDYMYQKKKKEEDAPAVKIAFKRWLGCYVKKTRKTNYSHQKQYKQYKDQQNNNK